MSTLSKKIAGLPMPDHMKKEDILHLLLKEVYGFLPEAPKALTATVESTNRHFCAGKAVHQRIHLTCEMTSGTFTFPVNFTCPTRIPEPIPCVIHINFHDATPAEYEPTEEIADGGFAVLSFCYDCAAMNSRLSAR